MLHLVKRIAAPAFLVFIFWSINGASFSAIAQGTWVPLTNLAPNQNQGGMLLLSDGTVIAKTSAVDGDSLGNIWSRLTPDAHGSYINGTWSTTAPMFNTRLYFSSQVLKDGRVYVAGGEYGSGSNAGEVYNPVTNTWTMAPPLPLLTDAIYDGNSEILPDGRVLQALVSGGSYSNLIYDPVANTYTNAATSLGSHDESAWVKLPDSSILYVNLGANTSERYIPSLGAWIADDTVPVALYDTFEYEAGAGLLLPDGRAFFLGSSGNTAYYTPSGNTTPGTWAAGPSIPAGHGTPDAPAAMMPNGKVLCAVSMAPAFPLDFPSPTSFYEFDYTADSFIAISSPSGSDTLAGPVYVTHMLDLPDGSVLFSSIGSNQYYEYIPGGTQLASGKPVVQNIIKEDCATYIATGKGFNGISEGAAYGDDWQMATNYPIIRLTAGTTVYYARSYNWNSTGVMTGNLPDTTKFDLPSGMPEGTYSLQVIANGIASDSFVFRTCGADGIAMPASTPGSFDVFPNPAITELTIRSAIGTIDQIAITNVFGQTVYTSHPNTDNMLIDISGFPAGVYFIKVNGSNVRKILVLH